MEREKTAEESEKRRGGEKGHEKETASAHAQKEEMEGGREKKDTKKKVSAHARTQPRCSSIEHKA